MGLLALVPKSWNDRIAFMFMLCGVHSICLFELVVILPYIDADYSVTFLFHTVLGVIFYVNIMSSFILTITTDATSGSQILPSILKPGWRFCSACEANAPPRSFHCWTCNKCILRRDHHCVFTGNCVGFQNMRYFTTMVIHITLAALYCNYLNMDYTWELMGGFSVQSVATMIVPMFMWLLGYTHTYSFICSFMSSLCIIGFFALGALLGYHSLNLLSGQTTFEKTMKIKDYNLGPVENIKEVFGERWYIAWLSPYISSPLAGNGIEFAKKTGFENIKDM